MKQVEQAAQKISFAGLIAEILFGSTRQTDKDEECVRAVVNSMTCSLHVQRLRQVWNAILVVVTPRFEGRPPKTSWPLMPLAAGSGEVSETLYHRASGAEIASVIPRPADDGTQRGARTSQHEAA